MFDDEVKFAANVTSVKGLPFDGPANLISKMSHFATLEANEQPPIIKSADTMRCSNMNRKDLRYFFRFKNYSSQNELCTEITLYANFVQLKGTTFLIGHFGQNSLSSDVVMTK